MTNSSEAKTIDDKVVTEPAKKQDSSARQAWRGWMVPAVGSAAFFASMLLGGFRNYKNRLGIIIASCGCSDCGTIRCILKWTRIRSRTIILR